VQLRASDAAGRPEDSANAALGDALKVVYRFLQIGMIVLIGVFLLSGLQSIQEGERGLRVRAGQVVADDLQPGFQLSLPRPLGEIIKVSTGNRSLDIRAQFWPASLGPAERFTADDTAQANAGRAKLDPAQDGMLLTGDLSIGHVLAKVEYARDPERVAEFVRNIRMEDSKAEQDMVGSAVLRGMVHAAASASIDDLRKEQAIQRRAQELAQEHLDKMQSGLVIRSLVFERRMVPGNLIRIFNEVDSSIARSTEELNKAQQDRQSKLSAVAGDAAEDLLALINRYDNQLTAGQTAQATATLAQIDRLLDGEPVGSDGLRPGARVTGEATAILSNARAEWARTVSRAQSSARLFAAKREGFASNPGVLLTSDWADAFGAFVGRDSVQAFVLPPGTRTLELLLNRDPEVQKEQERLRNELIRRQREEEAARKAIQEGLMSAPPIPLSQ
jgi:regulator of protease activity HflC (stomatin/prohibitin superfamily)